jgi:hypothetical protein
MKTRADQQRRHAALLHQLNERLTAARNDVKAAQRRPGSGAHQISRPPKDLLKRALEQLDQAGEILVHLQKAFDGSSSAENRAGCCYRVCFMNRFARGGNTLTACQRTIVIPSATSREAAIEAAKQRFTELEGIRDWHIHASFIEAGLLEEDTADGRETDERRSADHSPTPSAPERVRNSP